MDDIPARQSLLAAASSTWRWLDQRPRGHLFQPRVRSPAMRARGVTPLRLCRVCGSVMGGGFEFADRFLTG